SHEEAERHDDEDGPRIAAVLSHDEQTSRLPPRNLPVATHPGSRRQETGRIGHALAAAMIGAATIPSDGSQSGLLRDSRAGPARRLLLRMLGAGTDSSPPAGGLNPAATRRAKADVRGLGEPLESWCEFAHERRSLCFTSVVRTVCSRP